MNIKSLSQLLLGLAAVPILTLAVNEPSQARQQKFYCDTSGKYPVTKIRTNRGWQNMLNWKSNYFNTSKQQRCQIITRRLQSYYDNRMLYLTSRRNVNGYPVICIANKTRGKCSTKDVVITLQPGRDPVRVSQQINYFRRGAYKAKTINLRSSSAVFFVEGDMYVNMNKIIDQPDAKN
ncbi:MAG: hypothetical protein F6K61_07745 [Sphaerospermopsis sp. SIO1G1]|nr:hypothetical protein [Sphaerospermopsis sp. SIO1G1]